MILTESKGGKWNVPMMWDRMFSDANVIRRREEINEFNAKSKWIKRGLSLLPTKVSRPHVPVAKNMNMSLLNLFYVSYYISLVSRSLPSL